MESAALTKFRAAVVGARVLASFVGNNSPVSPAQHFTDQNLMKAAVAQAVGCWEGYLEEVLKEFVSKTRVQAHRKAWTLIVQFESIVQKMTNELNTPSWDKARDLILIITGMDPYASWIWSPKFTNQNDTQAFLKGVMDVRHSFAHGFSTPTNVPGLTTPGILDAPYVGDVVSCLEFFSETTDSLLEHELTHRHGCTTGWV
ncbi:HEPN domain-containing protein [Burkholderia stagnalis]|uniref:HEPN domain-containing protein n=1 Tax=Burkholderia stagnalis TaxID=1503054 RepID=UPI000A6B840C|nr:HEPN domain-containing protein [Burkholderia stagnalis]